MHTFSYYSNITISTKAAWRISYGVQGSSLGVGGVKRRPTNLVLHLPLPHNSNPQGKKYFLQSNCVNNVNKEKVAKDESKIFRKRVKF